MKVSCSGSIGALERLCGKYVPALNCGKMRLGQDRAPMKPIVHNMCQGGIKLKITLSCREIKQLANNALCCYPHVKLEIGNLSQITTTAPIFLLFNYFRENIWVTLWMQFHFLCIYLQDELDYYTILGVFTHFHQKTLTYCGFS